MNKEIFFSFLIIVLCCSTGAVAQPHVKTGIDVLRDRGFDILRGKRVGLITNPTGVTYNLQSTVDVLHRAAGVAVVALFGPEHGVRGDVEAGKLVENYTDRATGLPVFSLYGGTRKPTREMLRGLDALVYDIQDIGVRSYTYISTMGYAMEAAAEYGLEFIVLDRPNPLTGVRVEGPMLEPVFKSFVGMYPIPYVYGMTVGELARMINEEGWLSSGVRCNLTVVPMEGWKRSMWWDDTGFQWIPPSPNIPRSTTPMFYVMTGLLGELGTVNHGVGYTLPFELVGAAWIDANALASWLNSRRLEGVEFRPHYYRPFNDNGTRYQGVQIHVLDRDRINLTAVQLHILAALYSLFPERNIYARAKRERIESFDKIFGSSEIRRDLVTYTRVEHIIAKIEQNNAEFKKKREKYLLYD
ncbi:MAG: exo-beta-N-acetylmuramidase NamZ family protein [Bacteroidota bacterium]